MRQELQTSPRRMRFWSEELGIDGTQTSVWAGLALAAARRANPDGVALFSSRRPDRVSPNLQLARAFEAEPSVLARLSELFQAQKSPRP